MKLKSLLPIAFGKFHFKEPLLLRDGLNIISGDNEDGKTTLGAFILGMFYGFKKEGRSRVSRTPEYERFRPWQGKDYRGVLTYEEGGTVYRVERWFDPDVIKIFDEKTGEDVTRQFVQDQRKELDFAQRHLGLTQREFKNTIWVGQLGSIQEQGLGVEIQGKIESILQGTSQDLSLARALSLLSEERNAIKSQRSEKGKLDATLRRIAQLEADLREAEKKEAEVRLWMAELNRLNREKSLLEGQIGETEKEYALGRYFYLKDIEKTAKEIQEEILALEKKIEENAWASDTPSDCESKLAALLSDIERLRTRKEVAEGDLQKTLSEKERIEKSLASFGPIRTLGLKERDFSALRSRYLSGKANAARGERIANEARKELAKIEEEGDIKGLKGKNLSEDILKKAQDYQEIVVLAERNLDKINLEVEREKGQAKSINPSGAAGWIYALALGLLSIAVVLTVMGVPLASWVSFGLALSVFIMGAVRHRAVYNAKRQEEAKIAQLEAQLEEQKARVEDGKKIFMEYLSPLGVRSIEDLRLAFNEVRDYQERYQRAKEKYEFAHNYWFETASEFSSVEKELLSVVRSSGVLAPGQNLDDSALDRLEEELGRLTKMEEALTGVLKRENEIKDVLSKLHGEKDRMDLRLHELFSEAGVSSEEGLARKIAAKKEYEESLEKKSSEEKRLKELLSGRTMEDLSREIVELSRGLEEKALQLGNERYSIRDLESTAASLEHFKARKSKIQADISGLERAIGLRSQEWRSSKEIEEDILLERQKEEELTLQKEALDLALSTLEKLSKGIRREFAPALNIRTGKILQSITRQRYDQVRISPDLEISLIHPDTQAETSVFNLSGGTIDQCYFALRVAVAEVITKKEEFPFFLDDPFVQYDMRRLEGAMEILQELSKKHQILLFSCHRREEEAARRLGVDFNLIHLSSAK